MNRLLARAATLTGILAVVGFAFALGRASTRPHAPRDDSPIVARYANGVLTQHELIASAESMGPGARMRLATSESRRQFVVDLVRRRMLAADARAHGDDGRPEVQSRIEQLLADERVKRVVDDALAPPADAELSAYLEQHRSEYAHPERVRVAIIVIAGPATGAERTRKEREASELLKDVEQKSAHDFYAFASTARARSDDAQSRAFGGELAPMTSAELSARLPAEVVAELPSLSRPGQILDHVVGTQTGWYLVKLVQREAALDPHVKELREPLRRRVATEKRQAAYQKLIAETDARARVQLDEKSLAMMSTVPGDLPMSH